MFYDINVMNSRTLCATWRLANQLSGDTSNVDLTKICSSLIKCLESGRVSLRTSSVFVNGAARVYKKEARQLYRDCIKLNKEMIRRSKRSPIETVSVSKSTDEDSRKIQRNNNSDCKYYNRKRKSSIQRSRNDMSSRNSSKNDPTYTNKTNVSKSSSNTTKEMGVQTTKSYISDRRKIYFPNNPNIDENEPYGLLMVCDTTSRLPKKIIYSKINNSFININNK